jgi:translation initiation factor IF-2
MAEKKKEKKKATLIKHKKTETPEKTDKDNKQEKKKVVIVKKRVVKVKKAPVKTKKTDKETQKVSKDKKEKKGFIGTSPREPSPFDRYKKGPKKDNKTPSRTRESADSSKSGVKQKKTFHPKFKKADSSKKGDFKKSYTEKRTNQSQSIVTDNKPGKKFFKAKKKNVYQKKKHEHEEKILQLKKKIIQHKNPVPDEISILEVVTVSELARKMNLKASELISKLMSMGVMVTINQQIDAETATLLADEYNCKVNIVSLYDETVIKQEEDNEEDLKLRPPIVTVMGHVDHGKTKLLDAIRLTNVVDSEHGGITQHIGAYIVDLGEKGKITFLDTPGHEAFTSMRARGAKITDIVILVVAANDGVMPQTIEAIDHAKAAEVPIIVAINKVDLQDANPEKVKKQLADYDLLPEDWGGHTLYNEVSALKKEGIEDILESILIQAEMLELKSNFDCNASGHVLESKVDLGRGMVATVLIERGTLKVGDTYVAGVFPGKVRAMFNDKGEKVDEAGPSVPVEILGFDGLPNAGDPFHVTDNERQARQVALKRQELKKMEGAKNVTKVTLDNLYDQIKQGEIQELKVVVKGDVDGSVGALKTSLEKLSTDEVKLTVIRAAAGAINDNDVLLAAAYNAIVIGFHVRPMTSSLQIAEREKVEIKKYNIIYDAIEDIKSAMEGLLAPELKEEMLGVAEVRDTFKVPKIGVIAGCYVNTGKIKRGAQVRLIRDGVQIYEGKISSLKRFKDDAKEVETGFECGIGIENYNDIKVGDEIEAFEIKEFAKKLDESRKKDAGNKKEEN